MLRFSSISTALRFSSKLSIRGMSSVASEDVRSTTASGSQVYESKRAVFEYLFFHYGESEKLLPYTFGPKEALNFPSRCADVCIDRAPGAKAPLRALDIGCAVGASTFALAKHYDEVVGIDFSQHFIDAANVMKQDGKMEFEALTRGKVYENMLASVPSDIDRSRVHFQQGDACNLNPDLGMNKRLFFYHRAIFAILYTLEHLEGLSKFMSPSHTQASRLCVSHGVFTACPHNSFHLPNYILCIFYS